MKKLFFISLILISSYLKAQVEIVSTGTGYMYSVAVPSGTYTLTPGLSVTFKAHITCQDSAALNVSSSGFRLILKNGGLLPLVSGDIISGQVVTVVYDGTSWQMMNPIGTNSNNNWKLTGNSGTNSSNFVGTTDAQDLRFRTNNLLKLTLTQKGQLETFNMGNSVFLGGGAGGFDDLSNRQNTYIGNSSGSNSTTGNWNTALGYGSLNNNITGTSNTAIGRVALSYNTGSNNTGVGTYALFWGTTGSGNTSLGAYAGQTNTTGSNNLFLGYNADATVNNLSNATAIGNGATVAQSNSLILGNNAKVGIGTNAPTADLHVVGSFRFVDTNVVNNNILKTDNSGNASWTNINNLLPNGSFAWTKSGNNIYPTTLTDYVGVGAVPSVNAQLSVTRNLVDYNAFLVENETDGVTSTVSGTKGGRISVSAAGNNQKTGLEVQVGGTGTGQQNGIFVSTSGSSSGQNRGLVASASNSTSSNTGADIFSNGNFGVNYGVRVYTGGTQASAKYALYLSSSGSGTKYGVYSTGEDMNYYSGLVGIGTSPLTTLDVANSTLVTTSRFTNTFSSASPKMAVYGWAYGTGTGNNSAGAFDASGSSGTNYAVYGAASGNTGTKIGVYSTASGTGTNTAGYFTASGGTSNNAIVVPSGGGNVGIGTTTPSFPLYVTTATEDRTAYFYNSTNTASTTFGLYAGAFGAGGGEKRGGSFDASGGTGTNIGVRATASGGTTNWSAYFIGDAYISGKLGINDNTPTYDLDVSSLTTTYAGRFKNTGTAGADGLLVEVNTAAASAGTRIGLYSNISGGLSSQYGVYSNLLGGTSNYAVYGNANSGTTNNFAGYFPNGKVYIADSLGIGTTAPAYLLQLSQNSAAKPGSNTWTIASDARLKNNVRDYSEGLKEVLAIHPVWFTYTGEAGMPKETNVGVLAQELQKVAPYMVSDWTYTPTKKVKTGDNKNIEEEEVPDYSNAKTYLAVDNGAMTYMLINAIKEQQKMIDDLKKEVEALKTIKEK
ncbi:MAG: tail fiber domain-containing protein [Flavobacteriales bacterium]|nr:tail fiber domain-containing protein [Flavobacteriales bacterium]